MNAPTGRRVRVAVVFGGRSSEHAISCATAGSVLRALDRGRYDVVHAIEEAAFYGRHTGAGIAVEIANRHTRRVSMVLTDGFPIFSKPYLQSRANSLAILELFSII